MGNRTSRSASNQGQYNYPSKPNKLGYNDNNGQAPTAPVIMDCNEAAVRYGGIVIHDYGCILNKPRQGWDVPCSSTKQGEYNYPSQPNKLCYNDNGQAPRPPVIMDCKEAAERYGGIVICEYGSNLKKPRQGLVPNSSVKQGQYSYPSQPNTGYNNYGQAPTPPQNRKSTSPAVMDCNEAAERYGGIVICEYGSKNFARFNRI